MSGDTSESSDDSDSQTNEKPSTVKLQITNGEQTPTRRAVRAVKMLKSFVCPAANLTGHTEKVGMENFELLKVLGTGGESSLCRTK